MMVQGLAHRFYNMTIVVAFCGMVYSTQVAADQDLQLPDIHGHMYKLSDYRGQWVILNFWATWCPPCLEEIPDLLLFNERNRDKGVVVIGINFEDVQTPDLLKFMEDQFIDYPVLRMKPSATTPLGRVYGLPTTFIVSPDGEVANIHMGAVTIAELEKYIQHSKE
jgi:thiol-disulfide isomerase/thioredoxin